VPKRITNCDYNLIANSNNRIMPKKKSKKTFHRSAKTGRFVTKKFAKRNPNTTIKETR